MDATPRRPGVSKKRELPLGCPDCNVSAFKRQRELKRHFAAITGALVCNGKNLRPSEEKWTTYLVRAQKQRMRVLRRPRPPQSHVDTERGGVAAAGADGDSGYVSGDSGVTREPGLEFQDACMAVVGGVVDETHSDDIQSGDNRRNVQSNGEETVSSCAVQGDFSVGGFLGGSDGDGDTGSTNGRGGERSVQGASVGHSYAEFNDGESVDSWADRVGYVFGDCSDAKGGDGENDSANGSGIEGQVDDAGSERRYMESDGGESVDSWSNWYEKPLDHDDSGGRTGDGDTGSADHGSGGRPVDGAGAREDGEVGVPGLSNGTGTESHCDNGTGWLGDVHRELAEALGAKCIEGMEIKPPSFGKKDNRDYSPYSNLTILLLFVFVFKHQLSRVAVNDLFAILRFRDGQEGDGAGEGRGFDFADIPNCGEHFVSRLREYLPLLELWMRQVQCKKGKSGTAFVYDIPINLVLKTLLMSEKVREEEEAHPAGVVLRGSRATENSFRSDQVSAMATRPRQNARRTFMHGRIAASMPLFSSDAILTKSGTPVYISDFVMVDLREEDAMHPVQVPCRVLKVLYNEEKHAVDVVVRCFRTAWEVEGKTHAQHGFKRQGLVRVWEEIGRKSEKTLRGPGQLLDLCEIVTPQEAVDEKHLQPWSEGERREGWTFVCEGFVKQVANRYQRHERKRPWRRAGGADENFPDMRAPDVNHNVGGLPFLSLPFSIFVDDFNVWGMQTAFSEGATYWNLASLDPCLLRLKRFLHVATVASPGVSCDSAMAFSSGVIGRLEKGCIAEAVVDHVIRKIFCRGGDVSLVGDTPQRGVILYRKGANNKTEHPCTVCNVTQSQAKGELGGELGDKAYDIVKHRITRRQILEGREMLRAKGIGSTAAAKLSQKLGVIEPDMDGQPSPLFDRMTVHQPTETCTFEMLHLNHLNHLGQVQAELIAMLSPAGRDVVSGVFSQLGKLYGPGVSPLKDASTSYTSFTGSNKALFGSVQLIVFRPVLASVEALKKFFKPTVLKKMRDEVWGEIGPQDILTLLRTYLQTSSALSFAARASQYTDSDLAELRLLAGKYVEVSKTALGRKAVKNTSHGWLHVADSINDHGKPLDASIGEAGHQRHKRANKSGSGRDPAAHHARRENTALALGRMMRSDFWLVRGYDYSTKTRYTDRPQRAGTGCVRVLNCLASRLRGGLVSPTDPDDATAPTPAAAAGKFQGAAKWDGTIVRTGRIPVQDAQTSPAQPEWVARIVEGGVVPHEETVEHAMRLWFGCDRDTADAMCGDVRCPACWVDGWRMENDIRCSRFKHGAPPRASSSLGRWKGGDVRSSTSEDVASRQWALGDGMGEDVEIYTNRAAKDNDLSGDGNVTLGKILYFFDQSFDAGRDSSIAGAESVVVEWVLVYEYVTCGVGRSELRDSVTQHPTYWLQANAAPPSIFPVSSIRRHVHMYHLCPLPKSTSPGPTGRSGGSGVNADVGAEWVCGLCDEGNGKGGKKVWRHRYKLAASAGATTSRDKYMLNEHWHSAFQDGVI